MNKEAKTKELWDNSAASYSGAILRQLEDGSREIWLDLILSNAPEKERLDVLDLGTGPGFFSIILALAGHRAVGIDASPLMLNNARKNAKACGAHAEFRMMNIQELDFPDDSFDLLVCRNVTWTLYEPEKAYLEWKRVLRPGGRLLIFDANWYNHFFDDRAGEDLNRRIDQYRKTYGTLPARFAMAQATTYMRQLSLLGVCRPMWDRAMLWKLRFQDIVSRENLNGETDISDIDRMLYAVAPMFMVRGTKATPEQELRADLDWHWNCRSSVEGVLAVDEVRGNTTFYRDHIAPLLPVPGTALDAGCGAGGLSACLAGDGWNVTALDSSETMLKEARRTAENVSAEITTVQSDLCVPLPFTDESFDLVLINEVLWCLTDPDKAFRELARVLKPGGVLIIGDSNKFAHMHSEEDRKAYTGKWIAVAETSLRLIYGVTCSRATVIDENWDRLPLSAHARPLWDLETAGSLGLDFCSCDTVPETETCPESFVLKLRKPV